MAEFRANRRSNRGRTMACALPSDDRRTPTVNAMMPVRTILVDMDGVLADFEGMFLARWRERHPSAPWVAPEARRAFPLALDYPEDLRPLCDAIIQEDGYCRSLRPLPGAVQAVHDMLAEGLDVRICTAPLGNPSSAAEKLAWANEHLGTPFKKRVIIAKDKTLVRGEMLIDDKPVVSGVLAPTWEHVVFDAPYNRHVENRRICHWSGWRAIVGARAVGSPVAQ